MFLQRRSEDTGISKAIKRPMPPENQFVWLVRDDLSFIQSHIPRLPRCTVISEAGWCVCTRAG